MIFLAYFNVNIIFLLLIIIIIHLDKCSSNENINVLYPEKCHVIPTKEQLVFAHLNESNKHNGNKRDLIANQLKIHTHYHDSFYKLPRHIFNFYTKDLIPQAISYWETSLQVRYVTRPILLGRSCATSQQQSNGIRCENDCSKVTKCGDSIVIPEEHLSKCQYCSNGRNQCKENSGSNKSSGIHADFILYISAINTEHCSVSNTVAFASYCQLEIKNNRPVAGYVNICPQSVSAKQSDAHGILATLKHEILHALGFSAGLYAFFLDDNGKPLTPRDPITNKPPFNPITNMYEPSERVVKKITRYQWKINDGYINRTVLMIITPRVVDEVRKHFNCDTLEGAELEDQGDIGTKDTHWEKRVFENEAMTGTYTQNSVFSRITFAFLEDTGWYYANYSFAEELEWGKNLGCEFVKTSCKSWIDNRLEKGVSIRPFCNNLPNTHETGSKYECDAKRDAVLLCNLMRYNETIPKEYRNFNTKLVNLYQFKRLFNEPTYDLLSKHIGGSVILADYCPFMQQVSWSINNDVVRDSKCIFEENKPDKSKNYVLEEYGSESKCFLHSRTWYVHTDYCQFRKTVSKTVGCYNYFCDTNQGLVVNINNNRIVCTKDQIVEFVITHEEKIYFGNIICPSCEELCSSKIKCPVRNEDSMENIKQRQPQQQSSPTIEFVQNYPNKYLNLQKQTEYCLKEMSSLRSTSPIAIRSNMFTFLPILFFFLCF